MSCRAIFAALLASAGAAQAGEPLAAYVVQGDAVPAPLTSVAGDAARGRVLMGDRHRSLCVLCHTGPFDNPHLQGDLGPSLSGVGSRLTEGQIRLRVIDMKALNPDSIMPSYHRSPDAERVAANWRGKPVLEAQEIEDLVAYLASLKD